jgi:hypothetical protein
MASLAQLTEAVNKAINFLNRVKFLDTEDIMFIDEGTGWSARLRPKVKDYVPPSESSGGSAGYSGPFAASGASDESGAKIKIAAGECYIMTTPFSVASMTVTVTASGYVYLEAVANNDDGLTINAPEIKFSAALPAFENLKFKRPLAKVTVTDGKVTSIIQYQYGFLHGFIIKECNTQS